jgi:hypothetical protein
MVVVAIQSRKFEGSIEGGTSLQSDRASTLGTVQRCLKVVASIDTDSWSWRRSCRHSTGNGRDRQSRWAIEIAGGSDALDEKTHRHDWNYKRKDH